MRKEETIKEIIIEILVRHDYDMRRAFIFVSFLNVKAIGVQGDMRTYHKPVLIEILNEEEYAIAIPYDILDEISNKITNSIKDTNKVVWEITKNNWCVGGKSKGDKL